MSLEDFPNYLFMFQSVAKIVQAALILYRAIPASLPLWFFLVAKIVKILIQYHPNVLNVKLDFI